jgi:hypothetical protein
LLPSTAQLESWRIAKPLPGNASAATGRNGFFKDDAIEGEEAEG